jgi:hypothetical protein
VCVVRYLFLSLSLLLGVLFFFAFLSFSTPTEVLDKMPDPTVGGEDLDSYRARFNGAIISTYVFVMLVVPAKLWCRITIGGWSNVRLDDYLSIITLALANGFFWIVAMGMCSLGMGGKTRGIWMY